MKTLFTYIIIVAKKQMTNRAFWLLLFGIVIVAPLLSRIELTDTNQISVLLYVGDDDYTSKSIIEALEQKSGFDFKKCSSEDELKTSVKASKAECGYIIKNNLTDRLKAGETKENVILVERMGSAMTDQINEIFYSEYFKEVSRISGIRYLENKDRVDADSYNEIFKLFYADKGYDSFISEQHVESGENVSNHLLSARYLILILVFISSFIGVIEYQKDLKQGALLGFSGYKRRKFVFIYPFISTFLIGIVGIVGIALGTEWHGILSETLAMLIYVFVSAVIALIVGMIFRRPIYIQGIIPLLFIVLMLIYPVMVDISTFIPLVKNVRVLFPLELYRIILG